MIRLRVRWLCGKATPEFTSALRKRITVTRSDGYHFIVRLTLPADYKPGTFFAGGGERTLPADDNYGAIRGLDASTGKRKWEFKLQSPPWAGVLSTAGGLVFGGTNEGNFFALDAKSGAPLWNFQTGGDIAANPVSFLVDGKQRVAIAAHGALLVFGL